MSDFPNLLSCLYNTNLDQFFILLEVNKGSLGVSVLYLEENVNASICMD